MRAYVFSWHNDNCVRDKERIDERDGFKRFWCVTHGQWAAERPTRKTVVFEYGDGEKHEITHEFPSRV